jgi:hypothetical protein
MGYGEGRREAVDGVVGIVLLGATGQTQVTRSIRWFTARSRGLGQFDGVPRHGE